MKKLDDLFNFKLASLDFTLVKGSLFFKGDELTLVLNVQKSNYGDDYFINIGIWLNIIGGENDFPKENLCHVRFRLDSFLALRNPEVNFSEILYIEKSFSKKKASDVAGMIDRYIIPMIGELKTVYAIKRMYRSGDLSNAFIIKEARELLAS